jgi:excisionase family DNA binding protein
MSASAPATTTVGTVRYLSCVEAAQLLQVPLKTLYRWQSLGGQAAPPYSRLGKHVRYVETDIHAWVRSKRVN